MTPVHILRRVALRTVSRRRKLAAWLLVGWSVFWLSSVIQPCCQTTAIAADIPWAAASVDAMGTDVPCGSPHAAGDSCHSVTAVHNDTADRIAAAAQTVETPPPAAGAYVVLAWVDFDRSVARFSAAPPASSPLYLRLQRFLI